MSFIDTDDPFSIAAKRIRSSVIRSTPEPQLPIQGKQQPTTYIIEPDLMESQTGKMNLPNDVAFDDAGFAYNTVTGNPVQIVRRPNVLPIARTPDGFTPVMPKMLDIVGNVMGNVGGLAGGKVAANAGEMVLGSGVVRTKGNDNLIDKIVKSYNDRLPSIEDQYYNWAGKDYDYQVLNKTDFKTMYGDDVFDWPIEAKNLFKSNDEIVQINTPNETKYFSKDNAPSLKDHMKDVVSSQDGLFEAGNLNDIMKGLALKVHGAEEAASDAFKILAKEKGWEVGKGVRYFTISKGDDVKNIRISDHKNLTKSNPNASNVDINIAPGAHNFNDALTLLSDTRPQVVSAIGHGIEKQNQPFFSALERTVGNAKIGKADANQWLGYLKNQPGVKADEIGQVLKDLPQGPITKDQLQNIVQQNKVQLNEVVKGGPLKNQYSFKPDGEGYFNILDEQGNIIDHGYHNERAAEREILRLNGYEQNISAGADLNRGTKYHDYQLPGGSNYQEMLLTTPVKLSPKTKEGLELTKRMNEGEFNSLNDSERKVLFKKRDDLLREGKIEEGEPYKSSHWDEPNILAHVRYNDRNIPDVGKSLHLEEIQSDWHQAGRKQGYKSDLNNLPDKPNDYKDIIVGDQIKGWGKVQSIEQTSNGPLFDVGGIKISPDKFSLDKILSRSETGLFSGVKANAVPDAPFKKNWDELAFKRMLHKAANEGYDSVSWTPGEAQAARYDLSKQLKELQYLKNDDGTYQIAGITAKGDGFNHPENVTAAKLPDVVGKDMAEKIINNEGKRARGHPANGGYFEGVDLKIGGEGMKSFYDKMLVDKANALAKKYGVKVETKNISTQQGKILKRPDGSGFYISYPSGASKTFTTIEEAQSALNGQPVHVLKLTPELRAKAKEGFPLFSSTPITTPVDFDPFNQNKKYKLTPIQGDPFQ